MEKVPTNPIKHELVEIAFLHAVEDRANYYFEQVDPQTGELYNHEKGEVMMTIADLIVQRFCYSEIMEYTNHVEFRDVAGAKKTKQVWSETASISTVKHIRFGMLNHNTDLLQRLIKEYPEEFDLVWAIYVTTFMASDIYKPDCIFLKKSFLKYKIDIEYKK